MSRRIPSLRALQCFEQAARTGSVTQAAENLFLTQSAVSRQIKTLEDFVGRRLFAREKQRLILTVEGESYLSEVRASLNDLETATMRLISARAETGALNIAAPPTFGTRLLIPLLPAFKKGYPEVTINFVSRIGMPDFEREGIDAAVLNGDGNWPHLETRALVPEHWVALVNPDVLQDMSRAPVPEDLRQHTLLHIATRPDAWAHWLSALGVKDVDGTQGPKFEHFNMIVRAAVAGLGVALVPTFVAKEEVEAGRLVMPFSYEVPSPTSYFIASPPERSVLPKVKAFLDWLEERKARLKCPMKSAIRQRRLDSAYLRSKVHVEDA